MVGAREFLLRTGQALTALGIAAALFVGYEAVLTGLTHDRDQPTLLAAFRQAVPTTTLDAPSFSAPEKAPTALLAMPRIGLSQVVVEGTSPDDLKAGPGHLRASPMPGEYGNSVIVGRRTTYGGPFSRLDEVRRGDPIRVTTGQGAYTYNVVSVAHVASGRAQPLVGTADSRLTLVTSDPRYLPTGRLVVVTALQGAPVAVATRPNVSIAAADVGLVGDARPLVWLALWIPLLVLTLCVVQRLGGRWPRSVSAMLAIPVVLTLTLLTFSSLDPLLPSTL